MELRELRKLLLESIEVDLNQPRTATDPLEIDNLAADIVKHGQITPIIVTKFEENIAKIEERFRLLDGYRRFLALKKAGMTTASAVVLDHQPNPSEWLTLQLVIDCHRSDFELYDKFVAYSRLMEMEKLTATELAKRLSISKQSVTRILSVGNCSEEIQQLIKEGKLGSSATYSLARMSANNQEIALEALANGTATRDKLQRLAQTKTVPSVHISRVCCELPNCSVSLRGKQPLSLDGLIEVFEDLIRSVRKAKKEGYDVPTFTRILRLKSVRPDDKDGAKAGEKSAAK